MADNMSSAKSSSSLSRNIDHLSDDLLAEIFSRLPFRSTVGCKCASKRWLDLISSPFFIRQFISHQHSLYKAFLIFLSPHELMLAFLPPPLLSQEKEEEEEEEEEEAEEKQQEKQEQDQEPPFIPDLAFNALAQQTLLISPDMLIKGNVCGCSNGLLLCCNNRYTTGTGYFVYDPLTKVCTQIAPPKTYKESLYAVGFVCNPYYDRPKDHPNPNRSFRVVTIPSFIRSASAFEVGVFSSETGKWTETSVSCPQGFAFAPHWLLSFEYEGWLYFMGRTSIFVFNPYTHDSEILKYPLGADSMNIMSFGFLGSSCGSLRIADIGLNDLKVWELIDTDHWQLLHRTNLTTRLPPQFCANYYKRVGGFHPYDGDILYLHSYAEGVFVANLRTDEFEAIPGYEKSDISPFQLELPSLPLLLPPPKPSSG